VGVLLGEYVGGKFYRGIVTGLNEAFVIDESTRKRLSEKDPKSAEIIKPFLRGKDIKRWRAIHQGQYFIWTYVGVDIERYSAIFKHLSEYQERLEKRWDKGDHWWELRPCDYYAEFEKPKIVWPNLCTEPKFAFDDQKHYINAPACILIVSNPKFVLGLINSKLLFYYISTIAAQRRGGFWEFKPIYVEQLPIAQPSASESRELEALVESILQNTDDPRIAEWERGIDEIVYGLYGLTAEEVEQVERWHEEQSSK